MSSRGVPKGPAKLTKRGLCWVPDFSEKRGAQQIKFWVRKFPGKRPWRNLTALHPATIGSSSRKQQADMRFASHSFGTTTRSLQVYGSTNYFVDLLVLFCPHALDSASGVAGMGGPAKVRHHDIGRDGGIIALAMYSDRWKADLQPRWRCPAHVAQLPGERLQYQGLEQTLWLLVRAVWNVSSAWRTIPKRQYYLHADASAPCFVSSEVPIASWLWGLRDIPKLAALHNRQTWLPGSVHHLQKWEWQRTR